MKGQSRAITNAVGSRSHRGGIIYHHPMAFCAGIVAVTVGVVFHLPMYLESQDMHYRMVGMTMSPLMIAGMILIILGVAATFYGLLPTAGVVSGDHIGRVRVRALDDAPMRPAHVGLLLVMAAAITIDVMKPTTLAFVVPGFAAEYGLKSPINPTGHPTAALLPLAGIVGTVTGSFLWGWLGDVIGRRSSILLAAVIFIATSICGSMPSYQLNLLMCFLMGLGVGGMLPIAFTLIAEVIPARHRGWLMVLIGGDVAGAYIITSWLSSALVPHYTWRILWLIGLPTGLPLILLNRWIPESPRFLLLRGQEEQARAVMQRYGTQIIVDQYSDLVIEERVNSRFTQLLQPPFLGVTTIVVLLGVGAGLVSFGFQLWIPSNLQKLGYTQVTADQILRDSALIGFPLNFVVAWLYGMWSSKKTVALLALLNAAALVGFAVAGDDVARNGTLLQVLLIVPIWGISSVLAVLAAYSSEVYPSRVRSRGSGLAAGASKLGGVFTIALVVAAVTPPSIVNTALLGVVPMTLAAIGTLVFGIETRQQRLEEITAREIGAEPYNRT
jgi:putative MFS transporter